MSYDLKVYIYTRPHMRDEGLQFELQMGLSALERMFDRMEVDHVTESLFLSFPERHLNVIEEHQLYPRIEAYYPNLKSLTIKTHSVYIIQCTHREHCFIVDDASSIEAGASGRLYHPMRHNAIDPHRLTVLSGAAL